MDPHLDRLDLEERPLETQRYELLEGPEHRTASDETELPGYYRATFVTDRGDRLERFLTDAGYGAVLRRRGECEGDATFTPEEFEEWTVAPDLAALEARYAAEAGQGA